MGVISKLKNEVKAFYLDWSKINSYSPALQDTVYVTRFGWNHIMKKHRLWKDTHRRLRILKFAKHLLELATTFQVVRIKSEVIFYEITGILFVADLDEFRTISIIVLQKKERKYFLSIMDKKIGW